MQIHHTKHHQTYIDKLNAGLSQDESVDYLNLSDLVQKTLQLPGSIQ
jgi:Fe-Mn family superoxide dismutase